MILLFGFDRYYPAGGLKDLLGKFESMDDVLSYIEKSNYPCDYYQAYDTELNQIVYDIKNL